MAFYRHFFVLMASLSLLAQARAAEANEPRESSAAEYPVTRVVDGKEKTPQPLPSSISARIFTAPFTMGMTGLVRLYDEPGSFDGWKNIGLQLDYQYRFGVARVGIALHYRMLYKEAAEFDVYSFQLHDVAVPFVISAMRTFASGAELGGTLCIGPGVAGAYSSKISYGGMGPLYLPKQWYFGPILTIDAAVLAAIPLKGAYDLTLRGGVEVSGGAIFRVSTPLAIGIRKRW